MPAIPFLMTAAAVVGTGASLYYGNKASKAQEAGYKLQRQQSALAQARQRREAIRAARIQFAASQQTAENQGVSGSSSSVGGLGSIFSQVNSSLSFLDQSGYIQDQAAEQMGKAATYGNYANMAGDVAKLGFMGMDKYPIPKKK